jgi:hypothetical protein
LRGIGDDEAEIFVQENVVGLDAELPFVAAAAAGDCALEIAFAESVVLGNDDRRGNGVGVENVGAKGQPLDVQCPLLIGHQDVAVLIGFAGELDGGPYSEARRGQ